jgi:ferredoxin
MKPYIDEESCNGCFTCEQCCPEVFVVGEDRKAHIINENPSEDLEPDILRARQRCVAIAVRIEGYPDDPDDDED